MILPIPRPGLVISYSYLWAREAAHGQEEGAKDRPCAVVLATQTDGDGTRVLVAPITHAPPQNPVDAIELPLKTTRRLGLDDAQSWIVLTEMNRFTWPGPDIRLIGDPGDRQWAYGFLPANLYRKLRDEIVRRIKAHAMSQVHRSE